MAGNSRYSPVFVKARNEEELERKLLALQVKDFKQYHYINIYRTSDGVVAWLYKDNKIKLSSEENR